MRRIHSVLFALLASLAASCALCAGARRAPGTTVHDYVVQIEEAYDYDGYKAALPGARNSTKFFNGIQGLLAPENHVPMNVLVFPQDADYIPVMRQRAAIVVAERERWVRLVPVLLRYLDYAENLLAATPIRPEFGRAGAGRFQFPSMACEAITSFGKDALPYLAEAAMNKGLDSKLRLAAVALSVEIDEDSSKALGDRLLKDGSVDRGLVRKILEKKITSRRIAQSILFPKIHPLRAAPPSATSAPPPPDAG